MFEKILTSLGSRTCLVVIFGANVFYKALAVFAPSIHGHGFDSDEAIIGLMGLRSLEQGELALFFYGQDFGGGLEYLLTVAAFSVLPPSVSVLRIVTLALRLAADCVFYRITCLSFEDRLRRNMALLLFVTMSSYFHGYLARSSGVHLNNLLLGLALVHLFTSSARIFDRPLAKGVAIGLGLWVSDAILIFLIPAVAAGLARHLEQPRRPLQRELPGLAQLLAAATLACGPRLYYLALRPATWTLSYEGGGFSLAQWPRIQEHLSALLSTTLPAYFYDGLVAAGLPWLAAPGVFLICASCLVASLAIAPALVRGPRASSLAAAEGGPRILAAAEGGQRILAALVLMAVFWSSLAALILNGEVYDAGLRYLIPMQPFAAMSLALLLGAPGAYRVGPAAVKTASLVAATLLLAVLGLISTGLLSAQEAEARSRAHAEIIRILEENEVHHGWADYWASYDISFRTREEVKLGSFYVDRIPAYSDAARSATRRAFVFRTAPADSPQDRLILEINERAFERLSRRLEQSDTKTSTTEVGPYRVVIETPK
ncbi:MAG: hypothetical protein JRG96_09200 [Deltaproteobacteria bacterium]|nr:hypothetical protein [Deltaproteobacteria bacterium]MBW2419003.1 hypothetical protein [Deltaproteobacteria bacterium]